MHEQEKREMCSRKKGRKRGDREQLAEKTRREKDLRSRHF